MAQSVSELSPGPTKAVTSWLTDQIAPAYWRPNSQILSCNKCTTSFKDNDTKHHCRACGEGFCEGCLSKTQPVPKRGWDPAPVRVCDNCYEARNSQLGNVGPRSRKVEGTSPWHWVLGMGPSPAQPCSSPPHSLRAVAPLVLPRHPLSSLLTGSWGRCSLAGGGLKLSCVYHRLRLNLLLEEVLGHAPGPL